MNLASVFSLGVDIECTGTRWVNLTKLSKHPFGVPLSQQIHVDKHQDLVHLHGYCECATKEDG